MRSRPRFSLARLIVLAFFAACACAPAPASAASNPVLTDCVAHGALTKTYTISALRQALSTMSAATKEYTNCSDVINRALAAAVSTGGGRGTGSSGSGSFLPTPVIVILVILILAAVSFGALAIRRRRGGPASGAP
jgi:hypothetical protein